MRKTSVALLCGLFLAVVLCGSLWSQAPTPHAPRPGSINYLEGQASIESSSLEPNAIGVRELDRNQSITTQTGKAEILLTPGVFLRLGDNGSPKMISPELANTRVQLDKGRAMVEVLEIRKEDDIRIDQNGASTRLLKKGLYDFDAARSGIRVFRGEAEVDGGTRRVKAGGEREVKLGGTDLKATRFETGQYEDDFYRWCALRSGYLSEASVDAARTYIGPGPDRYVPGWNGFGWYWNPWFSAWTFLPPDGDSIHPSPCIARPGSFTVTIRSTLAITDIRTHTLSRREQDFPVEGGANLPDCYGSFEGASL